METKTKISNLTPVRLKRLRAQGYLTQTDQELSNLAFGIRFAYLLCLSILLIGVSSANISTLTVMMVIALWGIVLPNHPFDYIYNLLLSEKMNKPKLPERSIQMKFACLVATPWIGGTIYLFTNGMTMAGYVLGGSLILAASSAGFLDFCVPSWIYNMFGVSKKLRTA